MIVNVEQLERGKLALVTCTFVQGEQKFHYHPQLPPHTASCALHWYICNELDSTFVYYEHKS